MFFKSIFKEETILILSQAIKESSFCSLLLRNAKEIGFKFADDSTVFANVKSLSQHILTIISVNF